MDIPGVRAVFRSVATSHVLVVACVGVVLLGRGDLGRAENIVGPELLGLGGHAVEALGGLGGEAGLLGRCRGHVGHGDAAVVELLVVVRLGFLVVDAPVGAEVCGGVVAGSHGAAAGHGAEAGPDLGAELGVAEGLGEHGDTEDEETACHLGEGGDGDVAQGVGGIIVVTEANVEDEANQGSHAGTIYTDVSHACFPFPPYKCIGGVGRESSTYAIPMEKTKETPIFFLRDILRPQMTF